MAFSASDYMELREKRLSGAAAQNEQPTDDFASQYMSLRQERNERKAQTEIDNRYQSQLDSYRQSLQGVLDGYDKTAHAAEAQAGWEDYNATQKQIAQNKQDAEKNKSWFDKLGEYLGGVQDTSLPVHMTGEVTKGVQEQDKKLNYPTDDWTEDQKLTFGYLWKTNRQKAWEYGRMVNTERNRQAEQAKLQQIQDAATKNFGSGAAHTVGSILSAPLGLADTLGDVIEMGALGHLSEANGEITPNEYAEAVKGGISQSLNEKGGTLSEDIPIIGGKGWGDVYGLGTSVAQSMLAAHTGGAGQAIITSFGPAVQSGINSAKSRGATDEQAVSFGLMSGLAEALAEQIGVDNLLKIGSASTLKELSLNILKQGAAEGLEEGITSLATNFADQLVMKDKSEYNLAAIMYMSNGMSKEEAEKQAWLDMAEGVLFDMLAGFTSGGISGGLETGVKSALTALNKRDISTPVPHENAPSVNPLPERAHSDVNDLVDSAIASIHNAPSDPLGAALEGFKTTGTVTNSQARDILNNSRAVTQLIQQTGIKLPDTASGRRAAVKEAVAQMAQQSAEPIDTTQNTDYDNKNSTGGTTYAQTGTDNTHSARPFGANNEFAGVQAESRRASFEDIRQQSLYTDENETVRTRLSAALAGELERRGYRHGNADGLHLNSGRGQTFEVLTVDANTFHDIFEVARKYTRNGELVDLHSVKTTEDGIGYEECENYLSADGMSGFCITPDGDLISVFNADASKKGFLRAIAPVVKSKVKTLDCYMSQQQPLHEIYEKVFGMKVASVMDHNMDYDHDGIAANHNSPKVAFMVNSDSAVEPAFFGKDDYDAAKAYRDNLTDQHSNNQSSGAAPAESVGAAPIDFTGKSAYNDLLREGNVQPDRPGDVRPMEVPKTDPYGRHVSETAANLYGAEITPDETASRIEELIAMGALGFDTKTNKQMLEEAASAIKEKGVAASEKAVTKAVFSGKAQDSDIAKAILLYTTYANRKSDTAQDRAAELVVDLATMANDAGRRLQLFKLIRKMTPQGQLMAVQKGVQRSVDRINEGRGRRNQAEVTIPQELVDEYLDAAQHDIDEQTEESAQRKEEVEKTIYKVAAAQIEATPMEKLNAWRYMSMLGNAKTQVRNIFGNAAFRPMVSVKRAVGAVMEQFFVEQENRTKAILGTGQDAKALLEWAQEDAKGKAAQDLLSYSSYTGDLARDTIQDERQIFDTEWLETVRQAVQEVPEYFDMVFKSREYAYSLASFVKARGYTSADLASGKVSEDTLNAARSYAAQEALKATFNDHNAISDFLSKRYRGDSTFGKAVNLLTEGILPFRRTPANILARAVEYSPANIARSVWNLSTKVRSGDMSASVAIDQMASGLTGTAAMFLGYALASGVFGIRLRGKIEDEDEKRMGHQQYAIEIGDQSYTVDWLAPVNIPLFVGANLYSSLNGQKEDVSWFASALDAAGNSLEPMLELSCLSSLNDIIESAKYAEDGAAVYSIIASAATSYLTQFIPTLLGQVEQATETEKQTAYSSAGTSVERSIEKTVGRMTQRIPGLDLFQVQKYDAWGNEIETSSARQSFISPAYSSDITESAVDLEISRLNKAQSENVSPSLPSQTITYTGTDDVKHKNQRLTAEEYETMCRVQGQTQKQIVEKLISSTDYAALSDADKARAIDYAYDYARDTARIEVFEDYPGYSSKWMAEIDGNVAEAILRQAAVGTTEKYTDLPVSTATYVEDLLKSLQPEEGKTSVRAVQKMEAVVADDKLTAYVDDLLRDIMSDSLEEKYDTALGKGISSEDFVEGYRQYLDTTGEGKKQSLIRYYQRELGLSYAAAQTLYKIYNGTT